MPVMSSVGVLHRASVSALGACCSASLRRNWLQRLRFSSSTWLRSASRSRNSAMRLECLGLLGLVDFDDVIEVVGDGFERGYGANVPCAGAALLSDGIVRWTVLVRDRPARRARNSISSGSATTNSYPLRIASVETVRP